MIEDADPPLVRQEGRMRRRKASTSIYEAAPEVPFACGECLQPFKGDLDACWWNADDAGNSGYVCTGCFLALTEKRRQGWTDSARDAAKESLKAASEATHEEAISLARKTTLATHMHEWEFLGVNESGFGTFYCKRCPYDKPVFVEVKPDRP